MSTEDTIQEFAPALRTNGQIEAFRVALQMLDALTAKVEKHNQLIERTYRLEEGLSVVRNDIENLQKKVG